MHTSDPNNIAKRVLARLAVHYEEENLEEVVVNQPGEVWIKKRRGEWKKLEDPKLDYEHLRRVCSVLANINGAKFSETDIPVVSCELPGAPFRFQAILGQNVRYNLDDRKGVAIAIRALTADTSLGFPPTALPTVRSSKGPKAVEPILAFRTSTSKRS